MKKPRAPRRPQEPGPSAAPQPEQVSAEGRPPASGGATPRPSELPEPPSSRISRLGVTPGCSASSVAAQAFSV